MPRVDVSSHRKFQSKWKKGGREPGRMLKLCEQRLKEPFTLQLGTSILFITAAFVLFCLFHQMWVYIEKKAVTVVLGVLAYQWWGVLNLNMHEL